MKDTTQEQPPGRDPQGKVWWEEVQSFSAFTQVWLIKLLASGY